VIRKSAPMICLQKKTSILGDRVHISEDVTVSNFIWRNRTKKFEECSRKVAPAFDLCGQLRGTTGSNKYMRFQPSMEQVWGSTGTPATGIPYVTVQILVVNIRFKFYRPNTNRWPSIILFTPGTRRRVATVEYDGLQKTCKHSLANSKARRA